MTDFHHGDGDNLFLNSVNNTIRPHADRPCSCMIAMQWFTMSETCERSEQGESNGGGRGIRTLEPRKGLHDFESCAFDHSAIPPMVTVHKRRNRGQEWPLWVF